ncbi:MAG TPA: sugar transferase [Candidatus Paceibacterota bacterium]|nr:sugar transferase [Candidatus Paceibacterota bacterium]
MRKFLLLSDIAVLYASLITTLFVRYGFSARDSFENHLFPFSVIFLVWLLAMYIAGLYEHRLLHNRREFFESLGQAATAATVISIIFFYTVPAFGITPKTNLLIFAGVFLVLEAAARYFINRMLAQGADKNVLIVDDGPESLELARTIRDNPQMGYVVASMVRTGQPTLTPDEPTEFPVLPGPGELETFLAYRDVDTVVIGPRAYAMPEFIDGLFDSLGRGTNFTDLATFTERLTGKVPVTSINQVWFLENLTEGSKRPFEAAKRVVDIVFSIAAGTIVLALFPVIALAIRMDSPGPVLFRQRRTGKGGTPFNIVKFRTMVANAEATSGAVWAADKDPRVTRLGRILRLTRIDELPQLWNILRGQMSLVGPRAERPELEREIVRGVPFYRQRYLVKPGLSGWAQIRYRYGASVQDALEKLQYDLFYIKNRSLLLDLEIILKTIAISLRQQGR